MKELKTLDQTELAHLILSSPLAVVLAYTPTCGTCVVAKKMLQVVALMLTSVPMVTINLNHHHELAQAEEVLSIPCLLIYQNEVCVEKIYAIHSVPFLYEKIKGYL